MANRQYVGARYVPKFADPVEWDNVRQYEPLTIVTHLGNSFTSKKPVPAGVDIGNGEYWVNTGNYNEQIAQYAKEVQDISRSIKGLTENVKQLDGKKVMIIGDSLCSPQTMPPNWVTVLQNLIRENNVNCTLNIDFCIDGASYSGWGKPDSLNKLNSYTDEWDIIIVFLGINDYNGQWGIGNYTDTEVETSKPGYNGYNFVAGMNNLLSKLREKFPSAIQYGVIPHRSGHFVTNMKTPLAAYRYAIGSVLQYYGARIIDLSSMPMFAPKAIGDDFGGYTSASDTLHPTSVYAPILCNYILQNVNSGCANNWKLSGNNIPIDVLSSVAENSKIDVLYLSNGLMRITIAVSCNIDTTTNKLVTITGSVNNLVSEALKYYKFCSVNNGQMAEIGSLGDTLFIRVPNNINNVTTISFDQTIPYAFPMNNWYNIVD